MSVSVPSYLQILQRFWVLVFDLDFSIFSIPKLLVDSACILGSQMFDRNTHPCRWPKMSNGSKLKSYLTRKQKEKQWKRIGEEDSIVPAGVQQNLHLPCAATCGRQYHSVEFTSGSFELMCRAAGTMQEAGA